MNKNNIGTYIFIAIGEIFLVVVGILIAVQIDEFVDQEQEVKQQKKYYADILTDLKKDSVHLSNRVTRFKRNLLTYYDIYEKIKGIYPGENSPAYDRLMYNLEFALVTQKNQIGIIDKLIDRDVRILLNDYFQQERSTGIAMQEFNQSVVQVSRPFFLSSDAIKLDAVFFEDKLGFLPNESFIDPKKIEVLFKERKFKQILTTLRVSAGYALNELQHLQRINSRLIEKLNQEIK